MQVLADGVAASTIRDRLTALWERTGDPALHRLSVGGALTGPLDALEDFDPDDVESIEKADMESPEFLDWISTALMNCFRNTGDRQVFGLLYELNVRSFSDAIRARLRRANSRVDGSDVLHEVFLNIHRYPSRFAAERPESFRNWGHRIVRNTLLKSLKGEGRRARAISLDDDLSYCTDETAPAPDRCAENAEIATVVDQAYLLSLNLYWLHFQRLSEKEKRALTMVEIDGASYKETAAALGIRLENLKMVVFRGRRKVLRNMQRTLSQFDRL